jgi:hypothetical protein
MDTFSESGGTGLFITMSHELNFLEILQAEMTGHRPGWNGTCSHITTVRRVGIGYDQILAEIISV